MKQEKQELLIKYLRSLIFRILAVVVIFLLLAITLKKDPTYKDKIASTIYEENISFAKIKKFYTKYLGGIVPLEQVIENTTPVFNENLEYVNSSIYHDGVSLEVESNYLIPILEEGMVVYIGEKENYGNVVIIEGLDGISIWYGNLNRTAVKLYDYVEAGTYLGETIDNKLYIVYSKDNKFLDYKDYLPWK